MHLRLEAQPTQFGCGPFGNNTIKMAKPTALVRMARIITMLSGEIYKRGGPIYPKSENGEDKYSCPDVELVVEEKQCKGGKHAQGITVNCKKHVGICFGDHVGHDEEATKNAMTE
jgi:hypothetical protein